MPALEIVAGLVLLGFVAVALWIPAWWLAGRLDPRVANSLIRVPVSLGLALVGYLTFVNLVGRLLEHSLGVASTWIALHLLFSLALLRNPQFRLSFSMIWRRKRVWLPILALAVVLGVPQWFQAVSGNRWDEMASSAIHITAPNQFADGVFPPRHNAFPDIVVKYHYGFTLLSGTVHWLTRLSSNISVDMASTALWLFIFLFLFGWLRQLGLSRVASIWGGFAALLGGGLSWLYLPHLLVYKGFQKLPPASALQHSYDPDLGWWGNLLEVTANQNIHLSNAAGEIFPLPFDIAVHYQQHAVALGIALSLIAAYLFWLWQTRRSFAPLLLLANVICFGIVFLGHAVFGPMVSASAGLTLAVLWLRKPTLQRIVQGLLFTAGVITLALLHGGMLARGEEYGPGGAPMALRDGLGYIAGGVLDFVNWNIAGFGLLLLFSLITLGVWLRQRENPLPLNVFLLFFGLFALVSFMIPQLFFFSHAGGSEEQTEISKFFFCTHLSLAVLSTYGVHYLSKRAAWWVMLPLFAVTAVVPVASSIAGSVDKNRAWLGFYHSPYAHPGGRDHAAAGRALNTLKHSNRDQYFDFSMREATSGYLNELLVYGGSVFSLSPTRYETTGFGFLVAEDRVKDRVLLESRMARLSPGAAESSGANWLYTATRRDLAQRPAFVRSRFAKLVAEQILVKRFASGPRELLEFVGSTNDLDSGIEHHWSPKVIAQAGPRLAEDGGGLLFYNYARRQIQRGNEFIPLAEGPAVSGEFPLIFSARLPGDNQDDLIVGYLSDAVYRRGATVSAMVKNYPFRWQILDSSGAIDSALKRYWFWIIPADLTVVGDHDNDGFDSQLSYRTTTRQWWLFPSQRLDGPSLPAVAAPLPVVGRFLPGSTGDLAVWSPLTGEFKVKSLNTGETISVKWGGREGDILLPADFDGDGYDELGIWQPHSNAWWIRNLVTGKNRRYSFGSASDIPLPADYDGDGRVDLAYWDSRAQRIYVSFDLGKSVGRTITVPQNSIPVFVHMY